MRLVLDDAEPLFLAEGDLVDLLFSMSWRADLLLEFSARVAERPRWKAVQAEFRQVTERNVDDERAEMQDHLARQMKAAAATGQPRWALEIARRYAVLHPANPAPIHFQIAVQMATLDLEGAQNTAHAGRALIGEPHLVRNLAALCDQGGDRRHQLFAQEWNRAANYFDRLRLLNVLGGPRRHSSPLTAEARNLADSD